MVVVPIVMWVFVAIMLIISIVVMQFMIMDRMMVKIMGWVVIVIDLNVMVFDSIMAITCNNLPQFIVIMFKITH